MKIISLNTYGGTFFEAIMTFVNDHKATTDVFCFQEVLTTDKPDFITTRGKNRANFFEELTKALPEFEGRFMGMIDNVDTSFAEVPDVIFGLAIFARKDFSIINYQELFVHNTRAGFVPKDGNTSVGVAQVVELNAGGRIISVGNVHGSYYPSDKRDTPKRLEQSQKILDAMQKQSGEKIVMGDFNLFPDTDSIRMFEKAGYHNLVVKYDIKTTRGSLVKKLFPEYANGPYGFQEFADYTFVTPGLKVTHFEVPDLPLSDHLPMILEIE